MVKEVKHGGSEKKAAPKKTKKRIKSPLVLIREVVAELKKVTWPSRKEITSYSVVVVVFIAVMAGVLFLMDTVFGRVLDLILSL